MCYVLWYIATATQCHSSALMAPTVVRQCDLQLEVQIMQNDVTKWHWPPGNCTLATEPLPG